MTTMECHVCGTKENLAGVASSALGPISFCYCIECAREMREPEFMFQVTLDAIGHDVADHVRTLSTVTDDGIKTWDEWVKTAQRMPLTYG